MLADLHNYCAHILASNGDDYGGTKPKKVHTEKEMEICHNLRKYEIQSEWALAKIVNYTCTMALHTKFSNSC